MTRWVLALIALGACGKVEKLQPDAAADAAADAPADAALPVDPFVNGSFEQNYDGWTLDEDSPDPASGYWGISGPATLGAGTSVHDYNDNIDGEPGCLGIGGNVVAVTDGALAAFNAQSGPERHRIWQDIQLPAEAKTITFSLSYNTNVPLEATTQFVAVEVRDPGTDAPLQSLFYTDPAISPAMSMPMTALSAPVDQYAGQLIRITVDVQAQQTCLFTVVDDFRVTF
jgi:hypothetical protein